jgi:hypothetical protein
MSTFTIDDEIDITADAAPPACTTDGNCFPARKSKIVGMACVPPHISQEGAELVAPQKRNAMTSLTESIRRPTSDGLQVTF